MDVIPQLVKLGPAAIYKNGQCNPFRMLGEACKKPIIVATHEVCYAVGLELTLAADMCNATR